MQAQENVYPSNVTFVWVSAFLDYANVTVYFLFM